MSALPIPVAVPGATAALVSDNRYVHTLLAMAQRARTRLWCSIFIVDITPTEQGQLPVDDVLVAMAEATWRGADVRLLIGGSRTNIALAESADAARTRALELGVDCRWLSSQAVRGSHSKIVIADERVLTGSHNWSPGALVGQRQVQDSVLVHSADLAMVLARRLESQWQRAEAAHVAV